jgi:radical SAM superfamily enzyme YgiQ (UPF0313 family)
MRVLLLFPPEWLPTEPYLSLPMLTAVLRSAGHEVIQKDINIEMYDMMLRAPFLRHIQKRITHSRAHYQQRSTIQSLSEEYRHLLNNCNEERFTHLIEDVEKARKILKSDAFYDIDRVEWALNCFNETMAVISLAYYPAQIRFPPMETEIGYRSYMSPEILNAVDDERVNVFRDVYRRIVEPVIEDELPALIGISVVQKKQLIPTFTFCRMIKEKYPHVHIALGGNIITRIRDVLGKNVSLFSLFDTAILYEGETALLELVNTLESQKKDLSQVPNLIYRDKDGIHTNANVSAVDIAKLPPPDFDGLPLDAYFVPERILPYLATRGCYWGHCAFCDHSQGYVKKFRTKPVHQILEEIKFLKKKYGNRHFHFTDESYPPALFRKLSREFVREKTDIAWTTHMRFEDAITGDDVWKDAAASGCRCLYFGYESGNKRVLQLMNKATNLEVIKTVLQKSAQHGIWNHCMGFFGFPGETRREAEDSIRFLEENKEYVHSVGFMTFVLGKYSPVALEPGKYGVSVYKNPEWDLAMDYYFTVQEGMGIQEAADLLEEFERNHDPKWDLRTYVREYIFLYVDHFQTNNLPQLNRK